MSSSKMNSISDPLSQQKTAAANLGLQNYQTASQAVPGLQGYYNQNFGQNQMQTLGAMNPLSQAAYGAVQQDVTGTGGPYASLKQNLLGSFDAGNAQNLQNENQQLQAQGLGGTGAGMAVLGNVGVNAANQRALLGSNVDVQELNMANQLGQQLFQNNQQMSFQNPMAALGMIQSLSNAPQFQNIDNSYYTPAPKDSGFQQGFSDTLAAANTAASIMSGMPSGGGIPSTGQSANSMMTNNGTGFPSGFYNNPALAQLGGPMSFAA